MHTSPYHAVAGVECLWRMLARKAAYNIYWLREIVELVPDLELNVPFIGNRSCHTQKWVVQNPDSMTSLHYYVTFGKLEVGHSLQYSTLLRCSRVNSARNFVFLKSFCTVRASPTFCVKFSSSLTNGELGSTICINEISWSCSWRVLIDSKINPMTIYDESIIEHLRKRWSGAALQPSFEMPRVACSHLALRNVTTVMQKVTC